MLCDPRNISPGFSLAGRNERSNRRKDSLITTCLSSLRLGAEADLVALSSSRSLPSFSQDDMAARSSVTLPVACSASISCKIAFSTTGRIRSSSGGKLQLAKICQPVRFAVHESGERTGRAVRRRNMLLLGMRMPPHCDGVTAPLLTNTLRNALGQRITRVAEEGRPCCRGTLGGATRVRRRQGLWGFHSAQGTSRLEGAKQLHCVPPPSRKRWARTNLGGIATARFPNSPFRPAQT